MWKQSTCFVIIICVTQMHISYKARHYLICRVGSNEVRVGHQWVAQRVTEGSRVQVL